MPRLEISNQVAQRLYDLSAQTSKTIDEILLRLLDTYGAMLVSLEPDTASDDLTWTSEEVAEMLQPQTPLTGQEMVEHGYIGGWEDMEIEDSVEWLQQQKAQKRAKHQW